MRLLDKNRLDLLKTTASSLNNLEKVKLEFSNNSSTKITDRIDSINVEDDAEYGFEMFASIDKEESITVKSITNAVFAGAMGIKRGDQSQGWLKQHFVLSSDRNLYCFDHIDVSVT